jgi:hypothetical protein
MPPLPKPLHCIDFAVIGPHIGPNPLVLPLDTHKIEFHVVGKPPAVPPPPFTQITPHFGAMGLDCSFGLEVILVHFSARQIAVKLIHTARPSAVTALDSSGAVVAGGKTDPTQKVPQLLLLGGARPIVKVTIAPPSDETALLEFCVL